MEEMKNVRSAYVFDLKLLKEFYLVFGIYYKTHSIREISIGEGKYIKKQKQKNNNNNKKQTNNLTYFTWCSTPTHQH